MHNNIMCLFVLVVINVFFSVSLATDVDIVGVAASIVVPLRRPHHVEQTTRKDEDGKRKKRSISSIDQTNIVNKMNSLRSSVGASDMNYLIYSSLIENIATNWTSYCNFNADVYGPDDIGLYVIKVSSNYRPDPVSMLGTVFNDSRFYYDLRSVYLQYVGADYTYCSTAQVRNESLVNVYLSAYIFSYSSNNFNDSQEQYTLGEQCTTCLSGSYWCYEGLCKDDCSDRDSSCYCNSYCLNCGVTDSTTCRCQCLNGWIGSRCESTSASGANSATPTCSTTPRIPRTSTTASTTSTTTSTTSTTASTTSTTTSTSTLASTTPSSTSKSTVASTTPSTTSKSTVASTTSTTSESMVALTTPSTTSRSTVASTTASTTSESMVALTTPSTTSKSAVASTTPSTTSKSIDDATRSSNIGSSIGKSMVPLGFYAAVVLLSRI